VCAHIDDVSTAVDTCEYMKYRQVWIAVDTCIRVYRSLLQKSPIKEAIFCSGYIIHPFCSGYIIYLDDVSTAEYSLFYRALFQKRPIMLDDHT